MQQLLAHIFGDYILQTSYQALNKSKNSWACLRHVITYTIPFLLLTTSWKALLVIAGTHFIIDRYPIIMKKIIWFKNCFGIHTSYPPFGYCDTTGYYDTSPVNTAKFDKDIISMYGEPRPFFISIWLYIITDNFFHLFINYLALKYL